MRSEQRGQLRTEVGLFEQRGEQSCFCEKRYISVSADNAEAVSLDCTDCVCTDDSTVSGI